LSFKILVTFPENGSVYGLPTPIFVQKLKNALKKSNCRIVFPKFSGEEELTKLAEDADVAVVGGGIGNISGKVVENAKTLKLIQATGAGVDYLPFDSIAKRPALCVANTSGSNAVTVAEHAFALIFALCKHIVYQHNLLKDGTWHRLVSLELSDKTLGIIGLGSIGIEVAKRAKAFGMRVIAVKRHPNKTDVDTMKVADLIVGRNKLIETLRESDFVVVCVASTPETYGLIGETELRSMKKSAYLINVSRGTVVNEEALYMALKERWIAGAGIDTWYNYPPNPEHEKVFACFPPSKTGIHLLDDVVMTPHVGGLSKEFVERSIKLIANNIERIAKGEEVINKVNIALRY